MGRRGLADIIAGILDALEVFRGKEFTVLTIAKSANIKYTTVRKTLEIMEKISSAGVLLKVCSKPIKYVWVPREKPLKMFAGAVFWRLLREKTIGISEVVRKYGLSRKYIRRIFQHLVDENMARWIDNETLGLFPLEHYLDLSDDETRIIRKVVRRRKKIKQRDVIVEERIEVVFLRRRGRRRFTDILNDVLDALLECSDGAVSISDIGAMVGIRYETARRVLSVIEVVTNSGVLRRVYDRPRKYVWAGREPDEELFARAFFRRLIREGRISVGDFSGRFCVDKEYVRRIFQRLVDKKLAEWSTDDSIILVPSLSQYDFGGADFL